MSAKTKFEISIEIIGNDEAKKGHIRLTSGNLYFYRTNAKTEAARYTYQQLVDLIERDLIEQELNV